MRTNRWGTHFGDRGTFKLKRGVNACNIEAKVVSFVPYIDPSLVDATAEN